MEKKLQDHGSHHGKDHHCDGQVLPVARQRKSDGECDAADNHSQDSLYSRCGRTVRNVIAYVSTRGILILEIDTCD